MYYWRFEGSYHWVCYCLMFAHHLQVFSQSLNALWGAILDYLKVNWLGQDQLETSNLMFLDRLVFHKALMGKDLCYPYPSVELPLNL